MSNSLSTAAQNRYRLLRIYSGYRFALSLLLIAIFFAFRRSAANAELNPLLYLGTTGVYAVLNLFTLIAVLRRRRDVRPRHVFLILALDIAALVLTTHASGGINSGFAILLMVTVAAAAVFVPGQIATLVAAVATIGVLTEAAWGIFASGLGIGTLIPAGLLGMLLFAGSELMQRLAVQIRRSEEIAQEKSGQVIELQRLNQLIVQRMRTGILFIDGDDRVRMANQAAATMLGVGEFEIADHGDALPASIAEPLALWRAEPSRGFRPFKLRQDGPLVQIAFTHLEASGSSGTLVFAEDFTQIAQQAQQLKLASLGRLTASIAHEIRNPLGSISHAAQLLRESPDLGEDDRRLVEIVIGNSARTNDVIESVLTLSRGNQARPERLRLADWLRQFVDELVARGNVRDARVELDIADPDITISADPVHLRQVLNNLAENGLRYSLRATGTASLRLIASINADTGLCDLEVIDSGAGIPAENVSKIFEPFFTTERGGTGLGLYLSRELCEANQIQLEYENHPGKGSMFRLKFPHPDRRSVDVLAPT